MNVEKMAAEAEEHIEAGRLADAIVLYEQMISERPDDPDLHHVLGLTLAEHGQPERACRYIQTAITQNPDNPSYHRTLGDIYQISGNPAAAVKAYQQALTLCPNDTGTLLNLGNTIKLSGDYKGALDQYHHIIALDKDYHQAYNNIGKVYYDQGDIKQSIKWYNESIRIKPDYAEAQFNRAVALLMLGDYAKGWPAYEWRFKRLAASQVYPHKLAGWRWDGSSFGGDRLLVHCEQGMGDVIQFCRYLPMVKTLGGTVVLEAHAPLVGLLSRMNAADEVIPFNGSTPPKTPYSRYIPLMSLPLLFSTRLSSIPAQVPYLTADPQKSNTWQSRFAADGLRVGIVWSGSSVDPLRACGLKDLFPLLKIEGVRFFSLQKGTTAGEIELLEDTPAITHIGLDLESFDDTAAAIEHMDLIISIDTAVAHLAGAMGKPVWLMLAHMPDWRWMLDRDDNPWYPTARLFRQTAAGDWSGVVQRICSALQAQTAGNLSSVSDKLSNNKSAATDQNALDFYEQGCQLCDAGQFKAAVQAFQQSIAARPHWAQAHFNLGRAYHEMGQRKQAIQSYQAACRIMPDMTAAHQNLGLAYHQDGQLTLAAACFQHAIGLHGNLAILFNNLGVVQEHQKDLQGAMESYQCALKIDPSNPDAHYNSGNIHLARTNLDEAVVAYQKTLAVDPNHIKAWGNLGFTYHRLGLLEKAMEAYTKALKLNPDYAEAYFNRSITSLLVGDWKNGWPDYEWRFRCHDRHRIYPHELYGEQWDGRHFKDETLLVHSEQGIGDAIQFARYLPLVKERGGRVIFEARRSLMRLFKTLAGVDELIELSADKPPAKHYNFYIPLCSLPLLFNNTPNDVPNEVPYLKAEPDKENFWRKRLPEDGLNVGLVWGGNDTYKERSCTLGDLTPLGFVKGINWIGLQKGPAAMQASANILPHNFAVANWGEEFEDFSDTAAVINCLDLIISIDTSVAHLAGALGKPVWVLLPVVPDWRWLLERSQTPWYPSMRLFRQSKTIGWQHSVAHLGAALERWQKENR